MTPEELADAQQLAADEVEAQREAIERTAQAEELKTLIKTYEDLQAAIAPSLAILEEMGQRIQTLQAVLG